VAGWLPLAAVLAVAGRLTGHGISTGALIGVLTYLAQVLVPALDLFVATVGNAGLRFVVTLGRLLHRAAPAPAGQAAAASLGRPATCLELRGVTFRYGVGARPVLRDTDLSVGPGDHLAVVGPSGAGKSTLAGLLCGMLQPNEGAVHYDGVPVSDLDSAARARCRVLIPQEAYVFPGTVGDNLRYLKPAAADAELLATAERLGAEKLLERLGGLRAYVRPAELSAGERQLLTLVRAYLAPAPVAVLDEATCHLDPAAEERVEHAFAARGPLVVIAHRISSAERATRVLLLDPDGPLLGTHQSLRAISPRYREMTGYWATLGSQPTGPARLLGGVGPVPRAQLDSDPAEAVADGGR
ncbi:ABC transporter ATP-binding protein, partial [Actinoplanes sp. NPDC051411]|uniref:ABC transporter ATP-binding protein n=1 Tax=Actinoplanes sp. NPDC051411 TaxID=3155522 RepID=UPI00343C8837